MMARAHCFMIILHMLSQLCQTLVSSLTRSTRTSEWLWQRKRSTRVPSHAEIAKTVGWVP